MDQLKAIKTVKGKLSTLENEGGGTAQGGAGRYDPASRPDLITFSKDAAEPPADLQSRNERMFL
ncbi:MAG: hypothetical protein ACLSUM_13715 [Dysosmobacter welbionis]